MAAEVDSGIRASPDSAGFVPSIGERTLVAAVEGRSEVLTSIEALKELIRRRSPATTSVLIEVAADARRPEELRSTAAAQLGRRRSARNQDALLGALHSKEPTVVRRAAEGLGRIGDEAALERLAALRPRRDPVRQSVAFAKALISYRLGLDRERLQPPPEGAIAEVEPDSAVPLMAKRATARTLKELAPSARRELPAIALAGQGALELRCERDRFLIVFNRQVARWKTLAALGRRSALPAVVLKQSPSVRRCHVYEYLFTHPEGDEGILVFGVRATGVIGHFGSLDLDRDALSFGVRALDTPYSPPVLLQGSYDHVKRTLAFERALVGRPAEGRPDVEPRRKMRVR